MSNFFQSVGRQLEIEHLTITSYHPQTNREVQRFNKTIDTRLRHYVTERKRNWNVFVQPFTHAYNIQIHGRTDTSLYSLVLNRQPSGPSPLTASMNVTNGISFATSLLAMGAKILLRIAALRSKSDAHARKPQERYSHNYKIGVQKTPSFKPNDYVFANNSPF